METNIKYMPSAFNAPSGNIQNYKYRDDEKNRWVGPAFKLV